MVKLSCTHHALKRAKQRQRWPRRTTERMLERVFYAGVGPEDCPRRLSNYLNEHDRPEAPATLRIYGEHLYIFIRPQPDEVALVTVYVLPGEYRSLARLAQREHQALAA